MPSKTVSFTDEAYSALTDAQGEVDNFSMWTENLALIGLYFQQRIDGEVDDDKYNGYSEMTMEDKADMVDELVDELNIPSTEVN